MKNFNANTKISQITQYVALLIKLKFSEVRRMDNSRAWALDVLKNQPNVKITHELFDSDEYIYGAKGCVYDECGYLFEDWHSSYRNGMRMRVGGSWEDGWSLYTPQNKNLAR